MARPVRPRAPMIAARAPIEETGRALERLKNRTLHLVAPALAVNRTIHNGGLEHTDWAQTKT
eukprot:11206535-Lingulodinium_polyedra.AAC.1